MRSRCLSTIPALMQSRASSGACSSPTKAAFREALRVLKSGGRFLFEVWDRREEIIIQYTASEIVGRALSLDPGSLLAPPYHDVATGQADLAAAGFTDL